jgi:lipoprotein-releasing system permease protein
MTPLATQLWEWLTAAGGTLALSFIIAIALGICATTLLFLGSAVVVLERFARVRHRLRSVVIVTVVWAALLGALGTDVETLAGLGIPWPGAFRAWVLTAASALVLVTAAQVAIGLVLRHVPPTTLAMTSAVLLGIGYALLVGGIDRLGYAISPAVVAVLVLAGLRWRRRRNGGGEAGIDERLVRAVAIVLGVGALIPLVLSAPEPDVFALGGALLSALTLAVLLGLLPLAAAGFLDTRGTAEWFVATRYLFAKRRQTFISVITLICVVGVAAGVWLIITVLSVMNGFERTWREEIIGNRAHFTVHSPLGPFEDYGEVVRSIIADDEVLGASPYLDGEGMIRGAAGEIIGVRVRGIDPELIGEVTDLREDLLPGSEGALEDLSPRGSSPDGGPLDPGMVIGNQLAVALGVRVGDSIIVISPFGGPPTPLGPGPRLKRFRVAGVFKSSFFQYDEVFTYVNLAAAQDLRRVGDVVHGIEVRTTDYYRSRQVARRVEEGLGRPFYTRDWKEFFPAFFQALKTERVMMFVLLTMIMVVAAFAIVVTLIMMIMEKSSDIAIFKAMGATDASIERIFAIEGTLIGLLGTVLGVISGIAVTTQLAWVQEQIEVITGIDTLPATVYQFSTLPSEIDVGQVAIVVAIAMVLSLGATLLPSRQGSRLDPAEALRYE